MEDGRFLEYLYNDWFKNYKDMDLLEFQYHYRLYRYGNHNRINQENWISIKKEYLKDFGRQLICIKKALSGKKNSQILGGKNILSSAYFGVNKYLRDLGYNTFDGPWRVNGSEHFIEDLNYISSYYSFQRKLSNLSFQDLISEGGEKLIKEIVEKTCGMFKSNKIDAFIANSTHTYSNRIPLKAAQMVGLPTFVFLHGIPFPFYYEEPERSDYMIVWSEKIKENFVKMTNFPANRIYVSGHPLYTKLEHDTFRFSFDNVLIICPSCEAERNQDRGNMVWFLYQLESVLKKMGAKHARFRPHPHEDPNWYLKFVNKDFFKIDVRPISQALMDSTLVVGTISTVVLEALYYGVNYVLYDPLDDKGINIYGHKPVPPFDGTDPYLPVARTMDDLERLMRERIQVDKRLFDEYIQTPFDISFIKNMI